MINVGGLAGIVTTLTEKHAGFGYAYLISLCLMVVATVLFQVGYLHFGKHFVQRGYSCQSRVDEITVKAPPAGNVIMLVLGALRRRRNLGHVGTSQPGRDGQSPAQQNGAATSTEDETLLRETKAALKACLLL